MFRVYIWGTAKLARMVMNHTRENEVLGFIETVKRREVFMGKKVYQFDEELEDYDAIIVANHYSDAIYETAKKSNLSAEKFIFMTRCHGGKEDVNNEWVRKILGEDIYQIYLAERGCIEGSFYQTDKELYTKLNKRKNFDFVEEYKYPIISDKYDCAGNVGSYFWQDLWAAKLIHKNLPKEHYDIGSSLSGFIAHVLSFGIPVHMIDIRPFPTEIEGLDTIVADATNMDVFEDESIESLSALCSLEHFGLGRYGDPVDPEACFKCFESIQRKLKQGGHLYISVPVGKEHLEFNAHRVFYASTIVDCFRKLELIEFSTAWDSIIERNVEIHKYDEEYSRGGRFGLFHFVKR